MGVCFAEKLMKSAPDGASFHLNKGEVLGLVGESGSGKTTIGRAMINLLKFTTPGVLLGGDINFHDGAQTANLNGLNRAEMLPYRAKIR